MKKDIVERLRTMEHDMVGPYRGLTLEAADEIERLRERVASLQASSGYEASIAQLEIEQLREVRENEGNEIEQLREALQPFAKMYAAPGGDLDRAIANARRALEPKP